MADCIYWNMKSQFGKCRRSDNKKMWEWQSVELTIMEKTGVSVCICIFICVQIQFIYIYIYKYKYLKMWGWEWQSAELATMGKTRVSGKTKNM